MKKILFLLLFLISISARGATYYVATGGSDVAAGTFAAPWATWQKGFSTVVAGDTLYIRGGTYSPASTDWSGVHVGVYANQDGTAENPIVVMNYASEVPILKGTNITEATAHYGIMFHYAKYWHIKGLTVEYVAQSGTEWAQGIALWYCTDMIIEQCVTRHIAGVGMGTAQTLTNNITFLNCDSYAVEDSHASDSDADCFGIEDVPSGNEVILDGCRGWYASDDVFDFWESEGNVIVKDCWAWGAGYSYTTGLPTAHGGVGFKLGMTTGASTTTFLRTLQNCLAFENAGHGIAQNLALVRIKLLNNTIFKNGVYGIQINTGQYAHEIKNNISFNTGATDYSGSLNDELINADVATNANGWRSAATITNADFQSVDTTGVSGARVDGELPTLTFLHLATGSDAIDVGTVVSEIVYYGSAPDIGAFETGAVPPYWNPTGIGWLPVMYNANFRGEVNFTKPFKIQGVPIDVTGSELSILSGLTATADELNNTENSTSNIQTQIDGKADTSLNNLGGVAINTHLLPATDGSVNLGSATYKWGNIFLDSAKVINWNNGDITATHSDQTLTFAGGDLVIPDITGPTNITELSIGNSASATKAQFDSCAVYGDLIYCFINGDTVGFGVLAEDRVDISTVAVMLDDTLRSSGKHILYTQWQVDSLVATISSTNDMLIDAIQSLGSTVKALPINFQMDGSSFYTLVDSTPIFTAVYLNEAQTITGVRVVIGTQGNYTDSPTGQNRVGLYSISGTTLTLVASSADNGNLWKASGSEYLEIPFSSTYAANAGIYFIVLLYNNKAIVTDPTVLEGNAFGTLAHQAYGTQSGGSYIRLSGTAQFTDGILPASWSATTPGLTASAYQVFCALY